MLRTAQSLPQRALDTGLRPGPFPTRAASLLPGLLTATRTGLTPASDDEHEQNGHPVTRHLQFHWAHGKSRLGTERGGKYLDGLHFSYQGGQIRLLMSLISYLGSGEYRAKYFGVKIPKTNLPAGFERDAKAFAHDL